MSVDPLPTGKYFRPFNTESPQVRQYRQWLKISETYTEDELKSAFRKLSHGVHPDRMGGEDALFKRYNEAYQVLRDAKAVKGLNDAFRASLLRGVYAGNRRFDAGRFFGMRLFRVADMPEGPIRGYLPMPADMEPDVTNPDTYRQTSFSLFQTVLFEEENAITDSPEYDQLELMLGGKLNSNQKSRVSYEMALGQQGRDIMRLPWVMANVDAFYAFAEGDFEAALGHMEHAADAIKGNLVITFRLGLCHEALAHAEQKGKINKHHLKQAIACYREVLAIIEKRPEEERPQCIAVRKQMAYAYEALGKRWKAYVQWRTIRQQRPHSVEAQRNVVHFHRLASWFKSRAEESEQKPNKFLNPGESSA